MESQKKSKFIKNISKKTNYSGSSIDLKSKYSNDFKQKFKCQQQEQVVQIHKRQLTSLRYIGIYDRKFIITFSNQLKRFAYIDQHAIHERIRYQYYSCRFLEELGVANQVTRAKLNRFESQKIQKNSAFPINVLGKVNKVLVKVPKRKHKKIWGIQFAQHESTSYVTSYTQIFGYRLQEQDIVRICKQIDEDQERVPKFIDYLIGETSCKRAIKFNDVIDEKWCQSLLGNSSVCDFPFYCVHGRPTIKLIKKQCK